MMVHSWSTQHVVIKVVDNATGEATYLRPDVSNLCVLTFLCFITAVFQEGNR